MSCDDSAENFGLTGWLWWRKRGRHARQVSPSMSPAPSPPRAAPWNASVLAEVASWGISTLRAHGLGAYITDATHKGDFHHVVLGIAVMSLFVVVVNRILWRPLYWYAERKYKLLRWNAA